MLKNIRERLQRTLNNMETPDTEQKLMASATTTTNNNKKKKQKSYCTVVLDEAKVGVNRNTPPPQMKHAVKFKSVERAMHALHYGTDGGSVEEDEEEEEEDDFEEDDEEVDESETDLLDDDEDEVTLLISSDEEAELETQRISLPELFVKKIVRESIGIEKQTKENQRKVEKHEIRQQQIGNENQSVTEMPRPIIEPKLEKLDIAQITEPQNHVFPLPLLDPKIEQEIEDLNENEATSITLSAAAAKRRRGRPSKSKLTEATNIQNFKSASIEEQQNLAALPTTATTAVKIKQTATIVGRISYYAPDQAFVYQCTLCGVLFFNELPTYMQHLRTTHHVFKEAVLEQTVMVIIPQRKSARGQQLPQQHPHQHQNQQQLQQQQQPIITPTFALKQEQLTEEQPKDDKENIQVSPPSSNNIQNLDIEREPYFACGIVMSPNNDDGIHDLSLNCKFCDDTHGQEDAFKKHLLLEHQALITPRSIIEKSIATTTVNTEVNLPSPALKPSVKTNPKQQNGNERRSVICLTDFVQIPPTKSLMDTQAPDTPPPEESEESVAVEEHVKKQQEEEKQKENHELQQLQLQQPTQSTEIIVDEKKPVEESSIDVDIKNELKTKKTVLEEGEHDEREEEKIIAEKTMTKVRARKRKAAAIAAPDDDGKEPKLDNLQTTLRGRPNRSQSLRRPISRSDEIISSSTDLIKSDEKQNHPTRKAQSKIELDATETGEITIPKQRKRRATNNSQVTTLTEIEVQQTNQKMSPPAKRRRGRGKNVATVACELNENQISTSNSTATLTEVPIHGVETVVDASGTESIEKSENIASTTISNVAVPNIRDKPRAKERKGKGAQKEKLSIDASYKLEKIDNDNLTENVIQTLNINKSEKEIPLPQVKKETKKSNKKVKEEKSEKLKTTLMDVDCIDPSIQSSKTSTENVAVVALNDNVENLKTQVAVYNVENCLKLTTGENIITEQKPDQDSLLILNAAAAAVAAAAATTITKTKGKSRGATTKPNLTCDVCLKIFTKSSRLADHKRLHTGERPFQCDVCNKSFRIKMRLTEHKLRHRSIKAFQCNVCEFALATRQDLAQHMRIHRNERPHACPHCPKAFVRGSDLKIHLRIHTGEKPYVCDICDASFRANQNLSVHRKTHSGEKNYKCEVCDKGFMRKIDCRVHMRTHTGERPFKCEICERAFSSRHNVRTHIERKHIANAGGVQPKRTYKRPNPRLRAELARQKELIDELRNQLAQHIKTEDETQSNDIVANDEQKQQVDGLQQQQQHTDGQVDVEMEEKKEVKRDEPEQKQEPVSGQIKEHKQHGQKREQEQEPQMQSPHHLQAKEKQCQMTSNENDQKDKGTHDETTTTTSETVGKEAESAAASSAFTQEIVTFTITHLPMPMYGMPTATAATGTGTGTTAAVNLKPAVTSISTPATATAETTTQSTGTSNKRANVSVDTSSSTSSVTSSTQLSSLKFQEQQQQRQHNEHEHEYGRPHLLSEAQPQQQQQQQQPEEEEGQERKEKQELECEREQTVETVNIARTNKVQSSKSTDISLLAVVTAQPAQRNAADDVHVQHLLTADSITASTMPIHLSLPKAARKGNQRKNRKITQFFTVDGQKS